MTLGSNMKTMTINNIDNASFEISINGKSDIVDQFDEVIDVNGSSLNIRLTDTIWDNQDDIEHIVSLNWDKLLPEFDTFKIEFINRLSFNTPQANEIIKWIQVGRENETYIVELNTYSLEEIPYFWTKKFSAKYFFDKLLSTTSKSLNLSKEDIYNNDVDCFYINIAYSSKEKNIPISFLKQSFNLLEELCHTVTQEIVGFEWKEKYQIDESFFTKDFLLPLFRDLGYSNITYNHGIREYGKDILMSKTNPLGFEEHIGVQVKRDNIKGSVNSQIDEIIGQIEDAFTMPFYQLNSKEPKYISSFIIAISGQFTENAKEKILYKIQNKLGKLIGSIYFLDKEKLIELRTKK